MVMCIMGSGGTEVRFNEGGLPQQIRPVMVTVPEERLREMESLCGEMIDNTIECLNAAELDWKRTTRRGRILCETYEQDIRRLRKLRDDLRADLGWPAIDCAT